MSTNEIGTAERSSCGRLKRFVNKTRFLCNFGSVHVSGFIGILAKLSSCQTVGGSRSLATTNQKQTDIRGSISRRIAAGFPNYRLKMSSVLLESAARNILAGAPEQSFLFKKAAIEVNKSLYLWSQTR